MIHELHIDQAISDPDVDLTDRVLLITGASRGVGAAAARIAASVGADVIINYRNKERRAQAVATEVEALGRQATFARADLTDSGAVDAMLSKVSDAHGRLDVLILNASGGLEKDVPQDYSMMLNRDARLHAAKAAIQMMKPGSVIVFVTSHLAHYYGTKPVIESDESVAAGKLAGEHALRGIMIEMAAQGIRLVMVSGDLIDGMITPKLLDRYTPSVIGRRRKEAAWLPTTEDFATAIILAAGNKDLDHGATVFVGSTEW